MGEKVTILTLLETSAFGQLPSYSFQTDRAKKSNYLDANQLQDNSQGIWIWRQHFQGSLCCSSLGLVTASKIQSLIFKHNITPVVSVSAKKHGHKHLNFLFGCGNKLYPNFKSLSSLAFWEKCRSYKKKPFMSYKAVIHSGFLKCN